MIEDNENRNQNICDMIRSAANKEGAETIIFFIETMANYAKEKIPGLPEKIEQALKSFIDYLKKNPKAHKEIYEQYSHRLYDEGLIPKGYVGLSDEYLIKNFNQEGYITGLFVGYMLSMMALVDNGADKELILAVRDDMRPNLVGHHYDNSSEFIEQYKNEKYRWIDAYRRLNDDSRLE